MDERAVRALPREARPYQGRRAGLVTRLLAAGLDAVAVALALLVGYAGVALLLFLVNPRGFRLPAAEWILGMASAFVVLVVYQGLAWWLTGRTYGDLVMGLRVLSSTGTRLRFSSAFARSFLSAFLPVGILWVAVSRENRSLADQLLRTSVVYDWQPRGGAPEAPSVDPSLRPGHGSHPD